MTKKLALCGFLLMLVIAPLQAKTTLIHAGRLAADFRLITKVHLFLFTKFRNRSGYFVIGGYFPHNSELLRICS